MIRSSYALLQLVEVLLVFQDCIILENLLDLLDLLLLAIFSFEPQFLSLGAQGGDCLLLVSAYLGVKFLVYIEWVLVAFNGEGIVDFDLELLAAVRLYSEECYVYISLAPASAN